MRFEPGLGRADGRTQPDIGNPVNRASVKRIVSAVTRYPDGVDPERGPDVLAEAKIDRWEADRASAPVANRDAAIDLPEPAEQCRGVARLPCLQRLSNTGRGINDRIVATNGLEHSDAKTGRDRRGIQHFGAAPPPFSERAVPA